jgi:hypothetical protein
MSESTILDENKEFHKKHHEYVTDLYYPVSKFNIEYPQYLPIDTLKSSIVKKRTQIHHMHYHSKKHIYHINSKKGREEEDRLLKEIDIYKKAVKILLHNKNDLYTP